VIPDDAKKPVIEYFLEKYPKYEAKSFDVRISKHISDMYELMVDDNSYLINMKEGRIYMINGLIPQNVQHDLINGLSVDTYLYNSKNFKAFTSLRDQEIPVIKVAELPFVPKSPMYEISFGNKERYVVDNT